LKFRGLGHFPNTSFLQKNLKGPLNSLVFTKEKLIKLFDYIIGQITQFPYIPKSVSIREITDIFNS